MPTENLAGPPFDAAIVGGSYAGLSAALQLARARRRVVVVDAGQRRNRFAAHSHGFLGQDGRAPGEIVAEARAQLLRYPSVSWIGDVAVRAQGGAGQFGITLRDGRTVEASRLVLATGVRDELPPIEGVAERWGRHVFHCPYCHGYELNAGRIGVLAVGAVSMHHALMLPDWGQVTLFVNGSFTPDAAQREALMTRGVAVELRRVRCLRDAATVELDDGTCVVLDGLFTAARTAMASPLAEQLGCEFEEGPLGRYIRTDALKKTTVPGVLACGDAARAAGNVALSVGDGAQAGAAAHQSLMFGW